MNAAFRTIPRLPAGEVPRCTQRLPTTIILFAVMWLVILSVPGSPLRLWCGTLTSASDQYLDGSGRIFQQTSWHLGNALRTRGETYGIKLGRFYVSFSVRHTNPAVTTEDAGE
jgi:hypothetical protein